MGLLESLCVVRRFLVHPFGGTSLHEVEAPFWRVFLLSAVGVTDNTTYKLSLIHI